MGVEEHDLVQQALLEQFNPFPGEVAERLDLPSLKPIDLLVAQAAATNRRIERCFWFGRAQIDFDVPREGLTEVQQRFANELSAALRAQGQPEARFQPDTASHLIIGFHTIPEGSGGLEQRVKEVLVARIYQAKNEHDINPMQQNYGVMVSLPEDMTRLPKRTMEQQVRMMMARIGAVQMHVDSPDKLAYATLEGGLGHEFKGREGVMERYRDRLLAHALARPGGGHTRVEGVFSSDDIVRSPMSGYLAHIFRQFGEWGYIDKPFNVDQVASRLRAILAGKLFGWTGQSESAGAAQELMLDAPEDFRMEEATGVILATASGRFNIDKTKLERDQICAVSVVKKSGYRPNPGDHLQLEGYERYALDDRLVPSVEFDEMAAAIGNSPLIRVSRHPSGLGWKRDPQGKVNLQRARAFLHGHFAVEEIQPLVMWGRNAQELVEYIPANLRDFPYPVGCGKDIMFACSTDAVARSRGVQDVNSGILLSFFDAIDHGTHVLIHAEEIPGTDLIPENPYLILFWLAHLQYGPMRVTSEIAQI